LYKSKYSRDGSEINLVLALSGEGLGLGNGRDGPSCRAFPSSTPLILQAGSRSRARKPPIGESSNEKVPS
jgi:hypothetical protein